MVEIKYIEAEGLPPSRITFFDQEDLDRWLFREGIRSLRHGAADGSEVGSFRGLEQFSLSASVETLNFYPGPKINQPVLQAYFGEKCFRFGLILFC